MDHWIQTQLFKQTNSSTVSQHRHNVAPEHVTIDVSHNDNPVNLLISTGSWSRRVRRHMSRRLKNLWLMLWWLIWLYNVCPSQLHGTTVRARLRLKPLVNRLHTQHRTTHSRTTAIPHYTKILFQDAQKYSFISGIAKTSLTCINMPAKIMTITNN